LANQRKIQQEIGNPSPAEFEEQERVTQEARHKSRGGEVERTSFISSSFLSVSFAVAVPVPLAAAVAISVRSPRKDTSPSFHREGFAALKPHQIMKGERILRIVAQGPTPQLQMVQESRFFLKKIAHLQYLFLKVAPF
jgi:hypothetical protein